ncbi:isoprenylcysteine carboxylmethyltransferase family protein [Demequina sp. SYSU T00068]|uniref:methyltransferase family protein n=1 Tax=Demequina lignilytica TaxID=3051663 RepID=UPI002609D541|nr:isoprenylcysteine carboxylmethyltransferase family protein [Demequina sp. SYSU T00068]MDN4491182.1 isoprenylcysteine carboxylmethyltransferase family protein [Demequina sp. SYSU T00068]
MNARSGRLLSLVLVALQGVIFLAVGLTALLDGPGVGGSWWAGSTLVLLGGLGMFWSGKDLGRALTPMPTPNGAGLAAGGIYGFVRHPMYSAIIIIAIGLSVGSGHAWTWAFTVLLAVFFEAKTRVEEAFLMRAYPGYDQYAARTGKFLPGLGRRRLA